MLWGGKKEKEHLWAWWQHFLNQTIQGENWPSQGEGKVKQDDFVKWLRCPKFKPRRLEPDWWHSQQCNSRPITYPRFSHSNGISGDDDPHYMGYPKKNKKPGSIFQWSRGNNYIGFHPCGYIHQNKSLVIYVSCSFLIDIRTRYGNSLDI